MAKFTKKPVTIDAYTYDEVVAFAKAAEGRPFLLNGAKQKIKPTLKKDFIIETLEGIMDFTKDDMLVINVEGEIYPCKKHIFDEIYNEAQSSSPANFISELASLMKKHNIEIRLDASKDHYGEAEGSLSFYINREQVAVSLGAYPNAIITHEDVIDKNPQKHG